MDAIEATDLANQDLTDIYISDALEALIAFQSGLEDVTQVLIDAGYPVDALDALLVALTTVIDQLAQGIIDTEAIDALILSLQSLEEFLAVIVVVASLMIVGWGMGAQRR